ncbi:MAG: carbohydrate kinase family protein [Nitrososphaeria archaeon]
MKVQRNVLGLVGLGSVIVDFAPSETGVPLSRVKSFVPYSGSSVSNILAAASRLGLRTGFLGCVGDDEFGAFLLKDFEREDVVRNIKSLGPIMVIRTKNMYHIVCEELGRQYLSLK